MNYSKNVYALLLAGGSGERLWPLSRRNRPKQFLTIKHRTLIEDTVERISELIPSMNRWVVTTAQHADEVAGHLNSHVGLISIEPQARNTGPAILLNCLAIHDIDPTAVVLVLPTDHYISAPHTFSEFIEHAIDGAMHHKSILLFGAPITYPATGYGYIEYERGESFPYNVINFYEKPTAEQAQIYASSKNIVWNMGIFCAQVDVIIEEFKLHAPELYERVYAYWQEHQSYAAVPSMSIDHAIIEKSKNLLVLPTNVGWYDVGNLTTFLSLSEHNKQHNPQIVSIDSHNNLINVEQDLVALIGIEDICIVQTDDILLIAKRDETEKVKQVLEALKRDNSDEYL